MLGFLTDYGWDDPRVRWCKPYRWGFMDEYWGRINFNLRSSASKCTGSALMHQPVCLKDVGFYQQIGGFKFLQVLPRRTRNISKRIRIVEQEKVEDHTMVPIPNCLGSSLGIEKNNLVDCHRQSARLLKKFEPQVGLEGTSSVRAPQVQAFCFLRSHVFRLQDIAGLCFV